MNSSVGQVSLGRPIEPTDSALMELTWRKALQRGLVSEEDLVAAAQEHLARPPDAA
jgi:hypothetical protein